MLKIVHTINHENLAGGTFWNGNFDILIVFILWKLSGEFQTALTRLHLENVQDWFKMYLQFW